MHKEGALIMQTILGIALSLGLLLTASFAGGVNKKHMSQAPNRSPFRYAIVSNEVIDDSGRPAKEETKTGSGLRFAIRSPSSLHLSETKITSTLVNVFVFKRQHR